MERVSRPRAVLDVFFQSLSIRSIKFVTVTINGEKTRKPNGFIHCEQSYKKSAKIRLEEFWDVFEKDDSVLVVINADPDSLACAMAIKRLLRYRVRYVTIAHPNEISRLNNVEMVERLRIPLEKLNLGKTYDFSKKVMVDSQPDHLKEFEKISISMSSSITIR